MSAVHERERDSLAPFSPEALWQACKTRDGLPSEDGTTIPIALSAISDDGQCEDAAWPYGSSALLDETAAFFQANKDRLRSSDLVDFVRMNVQGGRGVILGVIMTGAWDAVGANGIIPEPSEGDDVVGGHAVVAVGYDDSHSLVLIRNSWGSTWGSTGHGWLPYTYVDIYGLAAITLLQKP
jgi:C1A family cysteine protease